eukprot:jgi/Hompol1/4881/HPOL_004021-RA
MTTLLQTPTPLYAQPLLSATPASQSASLSLAPSRTQLSSRGCHALSVAARFAVTTAPAAILIHDTSNQRCIASIPAVAGSSFTAPALFVPKTVDPAIESNDTAAASASDDQVSTVHGKLISASGRKIQLWQIDSSSAKAAPATASKQLAHAPQDLFLLAAPGSAESHIIAIAESGHVDVLPLTLDSTVIHWAPPALKNAASTSSVLYSHCGVSNDGASLIYQIIKLDVVDEAEYENGNQDKPQSKVREPHWLLRTFTFSESGDRLMLAVKSEALLVLPQGVVPISFAINELYDRLVIMNGLSLQPSLSINVSSKMDHSKSGNSSLVALQVIEEDHVAILSRRNHSDIVSVWETKYGSLQAEMAVNDFDSDQPLPGKVHALSLSQCDVPSLGLVLLAQISREDTKAISTQTTMVPFDCAPVSMRSIVGKLKADAQARQSLSVPTSQSQRLKVPTHTIIPSLAPVAVAPAKLYQGFPDSESRYIRDPREFDKWVAHVVRTDERESKYLEQLTNPQKTPTAQAFSDVFTRWRFAAHGIQQSKPNPELLLTLIKHDEISHLALEQILRRCFENPQKFWPRTVVMHLIQRGLVTSQGVAAIQALASAANAPLPSSLSPVARPPGIIAPLIDLHEYEMIELALLHMDDVSEAEQAYIVHHVCACMPEKATQAEQAAIEKRRSVIEAYGRQRVSAQQLAAAEAAATASIASSASFGKRKSVSIGTPTSSGGLATSESAIGGTVDDGQDSMEVDSDTCEPPVVGDIVLATPQRNSKATSSANTKPTKSSTGHTTETSGAQIGHADTLSSPHLGQRHFLSLVFSVAHNDFQLTRALRTALGVAELQVVIAWLVSVIDPPFSTDLSLMEEKGNRFPLWWLWSNGSDSEQKDYEEWLMAVDVLAIVVDAHLLTLIMIPELAATIEKLHASIKRLMTLMDLFSNVAKVHGRKWKILLEQVQNGVGDYSIEVFKPQK